MNRTVRPLLQLLLTGTALTGSFAAGAGELPTGASTVHGGVSISTPSANQMNIQQTTSSAIVNWQGFSIGQGARVDISQPSASSAILNRVTGSAPSTIAGQLNANGQVYLVNPNGVAITRTGTVQAGAFVASTLDTTDGDFKAGKRLFRGTGQSATVSNQGSITVQRGGYVALLGGRVENAGLISVPVGKVGLGAGEQATLDFSGDGFLQVAVPSRKDGSDAALIQHSGQIRAPGGTVVMQAATARDAARHAINLSGLVEARSVSGRSGAIMLGGGEGGTVTVSGRLDTSARTPARQGSNSRQASTGKRAPARGGDITVTGSDIRLSGATLMANGMAGGGRIRVGGDEQGNGPLQRASTTTVDAATTISADAGRQGNGGDVVIWSDQITRFAGRISATGGEQGGNGGQAEVSSHGVLDYTGTAILTAAKGTFGTLLLDPYNVTISNGADANQTGFSATGNDSVINATTLQTALRSANVTVTTGGAGSPGTQAGDITVAAPLTWGTGTGTTTGTTLTLNAYRSIVVAANLTVSGNGGLAFNTNQGGTGGTLSFGTGASASFTGTVAQPTDRSLTINTLPYTILSGQQEFAAALANPASATNRFALASDFTVPAGIVLDRPLNSTPPPNSSVPGTNIDFSGTFNGLGHTISGLSIVSSNQYVGVFGRTVGATIESLNLTNLTVRSTYGGTTNEPSFVGGLVGAAVNSSIFGVNVSGSVSGNRGETAASALTYTGGLIGATGTLNTTNLGGSITASSSSATVLGGNANANASNVATTTGGLVGITNGGTVTRSIASGVVTGGNTTANAPTSSAASIGGGAATGGLIGVTAATAVSASSASGTVTGGNVTVTTSSGTSRAGNTAGGLIGISTASTIVESSASGAVVNGTTSGNSLSGPIEAGNSTGGLIGSTNFFTAATPGSVTQSFATGQVRANSVTVSPSSGSRTVTLSTGGLVGLNAAPLSQVYATGNVSGGSAGGLVGSNAGAITQAYATGAVTGGRLDASSGYPPSVLATGGLIAINAATGSLSQVYALGDVTGGTATATTTSATTFTGGLIGLNLGSVSQAYAQGAVRAGTAIASASPAQSFSGGLIGSNAGTVNQTYATGAVTTVSGTGAVFPNAVAGGLIGFNQQPPSGAATVSASFWVTTTTGQAAAAGNAATLAGATGLTTAQFQNTATFVPLATGQGWNFRTTWAPPSAGFYPELYSIAPVVSVTADAHSKIYGQANPVLTGTVSGGPGIYVFDASTAQPSAANLLATSATQASGVGDYPISSIAAPFVSTGNTNYRVTGTGSTLAVTPAPLTIRANDQTKTFGQTFTFAGSEFQPVGLVNGDQVTRVTLTSQGEPASAPVTTYPIVASAAHGTGLVNTANNRSNYAITYTDGTLTVNPVPVPPQTPAERASAIANASVTPNIAIGLTNLTAPPLPLTSSINLSVASESTTLGSGGPTLGVGSGTGDGSSTVASGTKTLAAINTASSALNAKLNACEKTNKKAVGGYTACVGDSLETFAATLDLRVQQLPPAFRGLPAIIRQAAQRVRTATTIGEARAAVRVAVTAIRKAISLLRADEPAVARVQARQGRAIASALQTVDARLSRAVGL